MTVSAMRRSLMDERVAPITILVLASRTHIGLIASVKFKVLMVAMIMISRILIIMVDLLYASTASPRSRISSRMGVPSRPKTLRSWFST